MPIDKLYSWIQKNRSEINTRTRSSEEQEQASERVRLLQPREHQASYGSAATGNAAEADAQDDEQVRQPISDTRAALQDNMPPAITYFSGKQQLIRDGQYTYFDEKGKAKKARRNSPSKKFMLPILDNLSRLDTLLAGNFSSNGEKPIQDCFHEIILACENYLENRKNPWTREGKARKQMIEDLYEQVKYESVGFSQKVREIKSDNSRDNTRLTWISILSEVRTQTFEHGQNGVEIEMGGAGTSKVYIVKKNGVTKYFKENESMPPRNFDLLVIGEQDKLSALKSEYNNGSHTQQEKNDYAARIDRRKNYLSVVAKALSRRFPDPDDRFIFLGENATYEKLIRGLYSELSGDSGFIAIRDALNAEWNQAYENLSRAKENYQRETDSAIKKTYEATVKQRKAELEDTDLGYILSSLIQIKKDLLLSTIATHVAKIDPSSEISKRNVATCRMARLLGLDDVIATSGMADIKINGQRMRGILMDEAPGRASHVIDDENVAAHRITNYTPKIFRQLLNLQIFDIICGQVDRNTSNYICGESRSNAGLVTNLTELKGIDNDLSFGLLSYEDILATGDVGLSTLRNIEDNGRLHVPYVDYELTTRILNLTEQIINFEMCDLLSKEERKALWGRIQSVQHVLDRELRLEARERAEGRMGAKSMFIGQRGNRITWNEARKTYGEIIRGLRQAEFDQGFDPDQGLEVDANLRDITYLDAPFFAL